MKLLLAILGLAALAPTAHAHLLRTRNLRTKAKEPTKKKLNEQTLRAIEEDIEILDFWGRELGGSGRRYLKAKKSTTSSRLKWDFGDAN